jgi:hypothetical protein
MEILASCVGEIPVSDDCFAPKAAAPGCYGARERKLRHNYFLLAQ